MYEIKILIRALKYYHSQFNIQNLDKIIEILNLAEIEGDLNLLFKKPVLNGLFGISRLLITRYISVEKLVHVVNYYYEYILKTFIPPSEKMLELQNKILNLEQILLSHI